MDKFYNTNALDIRARHLYAIRGLLCQITQYSHAYEKINEDNSFQPNFQPY
jgi:hypothetical protein